MRHMHFVCVAVHVTGLGRGFNSFLWGDYHLAVCGEVGYPLGRLRGGGSPTWRDAAPRATHMEKRRAAAQVTFFGSRDVY